jgi:hypothetical protein
MLTFWIRTYFYNIINTHTQNKKKTKNKNFLNTVTNSFKLALNKIRIFLNGFLSVFEEK